MGTDRHRLSKSLAQSLNKTTGTPSVDEETVDAVRNAFQRNPQKSKMSFWTFSEAAQPAQAEVHK